MMKVHRINFVNFGPKYVSLVIIQVKVELEGNIETL